MRQLVLQHTGNILVDFDQAVKEGLLEKLEGSEVVSADTVEETMDELEPEESQEEPEETSPEEAVEDAEDTEEDAAEEEFVEEPDTPASSVRAVTKEEKELYAAFIQSRRAKEELIAAIDAISLAAYTGNVIITGEEGMDTLTLAKNMMKEVQMTDSNFSGKIAKISVIHHFLNLQKRYRVITGLIIGYPCM